LCGSSVRVGDAHGGKKGRCPDCRGIIRVPSASGAPSRPPVDPPVGRAAPAPAGGRPETTDRAAHAETSDQRADDEAFELELADDAATCPPGTDEEIAEVDLAEYEISAEPASRKGLWIGLSAAALTVAGAVVALVVLWPDATEVPVAVVDESPLPPQVIRMVTALDVLRNEVHNSVIEGKMQANRSILFARFGEKDKALAAMGKAPAPRQVIAVLVRTAAAQWQVGDSDAAAATLDEAIDVAIRMPGEGAPSRGECLATIAMACARCGDKAGAVRAVETIADWRKKNPSARTAWTSDLLRARSVAKIRRELGGIENADAEALARLKMGAILESAGAASEAAKAYATLAETGSSGRARGGSFALVSGIGGLIRCKAYAEAFRIIGALDPTDELRSPLAREIAHAQVASGDAKGALKLAQGLGDIVLVAEMHRACGATGEAVKGYLAALRALKPLGAVNTSAESVAKVRARVELLVDIGGKQARAGDVAGATVTFAKAIRRATGTTRLRMPGELWRMIANGQLAAGLPPGPFPASASCVFSGQKPETVRLIAEITKAYGLMPYVRLPVDRRPDELWAVLGAVQLRRGDRAGAEASYGRFMEVIKAEPASRQARMDRTLLARVIAARVEAGDAKGAAAMIASRPEMPLFASTVIALAKALSDRGDHQTAAMVLTQLESRTPDYFRAVDPAARRRLDRGDIAGALALLRPEVSGRIGETSAVADVLRAACARGLYSQVKPYIAACPGDLVVDMAQMLARSGADDEATEMLRTAAELAATAPDAPEKVAALLAAARGLATLGAFDDAKALTAATAPLLKKHASDRREVRLTRLATLAAVDLLAGRSEKALASMRDVHGLEFNALAVEASRIIAGERLSDGRRRVADVMAHEEIQGPGGCYARSMAFASRIAAAAADSEVAPVVHIAAAGGPVPPGEAIKPLARALRNYRRAHGHKLPPSLEALAAWAKLTRGQTHSPGDPSTPYVFVKGLLGTERRGTILIRDPVPDASGMVATVCLDGLVAMVLKAAMDEGLKRNAGGAPLPSGPGIIRVPYGEASPLLLTRYLITETDSAQERVRKSLMNLGADLKAYAHFNEGEYPPSLDVLRQAGMLYDERDIGGGGEETFPLVYIPGATPVGPSYRGVSQIVALATTASMQRLTLDAPGPASRPADPAGRLVSRDMPWGFCLRSNGKVGPISGTRPLSTLMGAATGAEAGLTYARLKIRPDDPPYLMVRKRAWNVRAALETYAKAHGGTYPPSLMTLASEGLIAEEELRSPGNNSRAYVYFAGQSVRSPAKHVLFYDPAMYTSVIGNRVYVAAHVGGGLAYAGRPSEFQGMSVQVRLSL